MLKHFALGASLLALAASGAVAAEPTDATTAATLTGTAAFTSWQDSKPGVSRLIRPADIPAPFLTKSESNAPGLAAMPTGAKPVVPAGFKVEAVATGLDAPRVIRTAPNGDLFVADSGSGEIRVLRMNGDSPEPAENAVFASGLDQPYGIAFYPSGPDPKWVYVANTGSVVRFPYAIGELKASGAAETVVAELPTGYHWTRDIVFAPDDSRMYVSVGSGSNIAEDVTGTPDGGIPAFAADHPLGAMWGEEADRADVLSFKPDGSDKQVVATGLRNCSGMTIQPGTGALWCVVNERDELGDNVPPDYATSVEQGGFYGWPWYYIGDHEDPRAPLKGQRPDLAGKVTVPDVLFEAHSAPLGITFYEGTMFPDAYKGDAFVAMHGSWNRGSRTGYKVVRMMVDDNGKPTGVYEDFMTGFVLSKDKVWGRPVGVAVADDGSLYVTEDGAGTIWRITHDGQSS